MMKPIDEIPGPNEVKTLEEAEERFLKNRGRLRSRSEAVALALEGSLQTPPSPTVGRRNSRS
jgi:hypothetical protein